MGITGLFGLLKSIQRPCNLKKFSGQTMGVDAYGWLHRGTVACAIDLTVNVQTTKYVDFVMNRVRMLIYFGVVPYLVFDGDNLPSKAETERARANRREESKKLGLELYRAGKTSQAHKELQKAVDVTPYMARQLIEELKKMNVQYIVAPYEADAQLVYLERQGIINGIISEDSDMLVFGAKRLLTKLDPHGDCVEINRSDFAACRDVSLIGWTDTEFRHMCILSGCDYLPSIPQMGLKKAHRNIQKHKTIEKIVRMLQFEGHSRVPENYLENFRRAELTFLHQWVFCPIAKKLVMLTPFIGNTKEEGELTFIGDNIEPEIATGVACGDLDPITKTVINFIPSPSERSRQTTTRSQRLSSSADLKPRQQITSFFTPKRVPLSELDPNSLTPSPSQRRLLEQHTNKSWSASVAPRRTDSTGSVSHITVSQPEARSVAESARERFLTRAATVSKACPAKRQRLCSDTDTESLPVSVVESRSRFFLVPAVQKSLVSRRETVDKKKSNEPDYGLFSDEVVEEIMSQLLDDPGSIKVSISDSFGVETTPATDSRDSRRLEPDRDSVTHSKIPAIQTGDEIDNLKGTASATADNGLATSYLDVTAKSEIALPPCSGSQTPNTVPVSINSDPGLFNRIVEYHIGKQNSKLHASYACCQGETKSKPGTLGLFTGTLVHDRPGVELNTNVNKSAPASTTRRKDLKHRQRPTPLELLKHAALSLSKSVHILKPSALGDCTAHRSGYDLDSTPSRSHAAKVCTSLTAYKGSEDLIVPNSDEEREEYDQEDAGRIPCSFDFKKFRFSPT